MSVTVKDLGWKRIYRQIKELDGKEITVGLHEDTGTVNKVPVVMIGVWNEFGVPVGRKKVFGKLAKRGQPARSFLRYTFDKYNEKYLRKSKDGLNRVYNGSLTVRAMLDKIGNEHRLDVKTRIIEFKNPGNADLTIKLKGFDDPLMHTGLMYSLIKFKVK